MYTSYHCQLPLSFLHIHNWTWLQYYLLILYTIITSIFCKWQHIQAYACTYIYTISVTVAGQINVISTKVLPVHNSQYVCVYTVKPSPPAVSTL